MRTTRQKFNLILTLAAMLTMVQTAWAANEETVTWTMDGGKSGQTTPSNDYTLSNTDGMEIHYSCTGDAKIICNSNSKSTRFYHFISGSGVIEFANLKGTVTKVELKRFKFDQSGMQMYVGLNKNSTSTLLHLQGNNSDYDFPSEDNGVLNSSVIFEGSVEVSESEPLKIMFSGSSQIEDFVFSNGSIVVTYTPAAAVDLGHTFTSENAISASGNVLTATCDNNDASHHCDLTNRKATLTLSAEDVSYDYYRHIAELQPTLGTFKSQTGIENLTSSGISYTNKETNEVSTTGPSAVGSYTATATININGTNYTLTKDFSILTGFKVNNNYTQFSVNKVSALEGEAMTITYTQLMDEILEGLTLTGATSGNNIAYTQSGNIYTLNMPAEDVNINATITYPLNEDNITQSGDTYTIKTAEGWNYFCQRMDVDADLNGFSGKTVMLDDDITVTTMAGSGKYPFKGTFDGDGHTLTFNYTADVPNCAPFCITNGATIRNLHATGLIDGGNWNYMGGLVGSASGNLTIENCHVSTQISSTINGEAEHGGFVGLLSSQYNQCHITGCVFDGLICNPNTWNQTYGCGGFVGAMSQYAYVDLTDCLFLHGQYDNNGNKCELYWGYDNDKNSTFFYRSNGYGEGKLTNCFYVGTRGLKQGSPAVESADAPDNFAHFGTPTDHCFLKVYGHTMVFDGKYYTPTYGDLVETYSYSGEKSYIIEYDDMPLGIKDVKTKQRTNYLRYNRPFTRDKAVTIMLPFDFTKNDIRRGEYDNISEGKFYEFAGIEEVPFNFWIAVMREVGVEGSNEVTTMKANTPYLFMPGEDAKYLYFTNGDDYYQGFDIFTEGYERGNKQTEYDGSDGTYSWNKWNFKGTYQPRYWSDSENSEEIGKVYGFAGATKEVDEQLVVAGDFVRAKSGAKIRPTSCYFVWTGEGTGQGTGSNNDFVLTLPEHFKILSVDGQPYTGNGQDLSKGSTIVIELEAGYSATNVEATEQSNGNRSTPPEEIPDYDDYIE
jgi:hypothetical protein